MTKLKAAQKIDKIAKKISSIVPKEARKYTSERIIHQIRYGTVSG